MRDSSAQTYGRLAISRRIPCKANARLEIFPLALHSRFAGEPGITRITEAWRGARNDLALDAFVEILQSEVVNVAVGESHRDERRPTKSIVQRHLPCRLPGVL